jgi:outer membrane protein assembly factor BamB
MIKLKYKSPIRLKKQRLPTIVTGILILLMISTAFFTFSSTQDTQVKAQTTTTTSTVPSNMLQYEWPISCADSARSFYSTGPAPSSPNIKWKITLPGANGWPVAFNGMLFIQTYEKSYALDANTGNVIWTAPLLGDKYKIDDTYMMIGSTCVKIADGSVAWVAPEGFSFGFHITNGVGYVPDVKMFLADEYGWSLADPSKPPVLVWNHTANIDVGKPFGSFGINHCIYGVGILAVGFEDGFLRGYNATTGEFLWETPVTTVFSYA